MSPGPTRALVGIGGLLGHDANAALIVNGRLVAASQEERFSRTKHDGAFPFAALADCLRIGQVAAEAVTDVVFAEKPLQNLLFDLTARPGNAATRLLGRLVPEAWGGYYTRPARDLFPRARFHYAWHHLTHVAGAFHTSPFARTAFLCVDGKGEDYSASSGVIDHEHLELLEEQRYENGLGMFYTLITYHLGFHSFGSEYKVMGLAPYGRPRFVERLTRLFVTDDDGGLRLRAPIRFTDASLMAALPLVAEATQVPPRPSAAPLTDDHVDLAASLQQIFEAEVLKMARRVRQRTGEDNLVFCGGCAQNCVTAGALRRSGIFRRVFNSPVGGDMGSGLGAALLLEREQAAGRPVAVDARGFYLGSEPGEIPAAAAAWRVPVAGDLFEFVAAELAAGRIVAWVRGRMELGARALGARSILADARQPGMQSRLNLAVKFRESFRPFAPLVLAEDCAEWFDTTEASDYMQYTAHLVAARRSPQPAQFASLREQLDFPRSEIGSVIHVDYSARLQTIRPEIHGDMHRLLTAFKRRTGTPILINTSFNVAGQPIVRTAAEGWECFVHTDIDLLVLNDQVYRNPFDKTREEKLAWLRRFARSA
ncbi:MAG TPA: carbamoyltransferase C-terminal domain-containing protein [Lacunisphaera sp.]|nr:carbamoyltransferase C-terminal domain-containing protein [Lacunisphaera sp.]